MKKRIQRAVAVVVFVAMGLGIFANVSEVLRKKAGNYSDMIHSFYDLKKDSIDVLCLGSSHGFASFQPNIMWEKYGLTSYVMCSMQQTVTDSYYLLQEALKHQKPKVVVLESYYFFFGQHYTSKASFRLATDSIPIGKVKHSVVEEVVGESDWKTKLSFYVPFLLYHSRWSDLKDWDFNSRTFLKGSTMVTDVFSIPEEKTILPEEGSKLPQLVETYLDKIIETCKENEIELLVYGAPYGYNKKEEAYLRKQKVNVALEKILPEKGVPYLFYQKGNLAGIDYSTDFSDYMHMNLSGAVRLSTHLGAYLTEHYDLPDHRGEAAYQSWQEDYEKFAAAAEEAGYPVEGS